MLNSTTTDPMGRTTPSETRRIRTATWAATKLPTENGSNTNPAAAMDTPSP